MTDQSPSTEHAPYEVVVLVEEDLSPGDAQRITALHEQLSAQGDRVRYHLLVPTDDGAARVQSAMGSFAMNEPLGPVPSPQEAEQLAAAEQSAAERSLASSLEAMTGAGAEVGGETIEGHPVDVLRSVVSDRGAREAIVVTGRHVVAEFFNVDWASQAERHLGIPVLHLVEHETFSEQAGGAGGVTGL